MSKILVPTWLDEILSWTISMIFRALGVLLTLGICFCIGWVLGLGLVALSIINMDQLFSAAKFFAVFVTGISLVWTLISSPSRYTDEKPCKNSYIEQYGYECNVPQCDEKHETARDAMSHNQMYWK